MTDLTMQDVLDSVCINQYIYVCVAYIFKAEEDPSRSFNRKWAQKFLSGTGPFFKTIQSAGVPQTRY